MKPTLVFDLEIYRDYFLAMFRNVETGNTKAFELYAGHQFDCDTVTSILNGYRLISFNGNSFDIPLLTLALTGANNALLKKACDAIIKNNLRGYQFAKMFNILIPKGIDHVDLIEVAPGSASLKIYGGRLHAQKMQDLPIDTEASISPGQRVELKTYCGNDLELTLALFKKLSPQIQLREAMSEIYGEDLRSKSDAQIAETVIKSQVETLARERPERPDIKAGTAFKYRAPEYISFDTRVLSDLWAMIENARFIVNDSGKIIEPDAFKKCTVTIGKSTYRLGIGGLHSAEKSVSHVTDANTIIVDRDVASYYPAIILTSGLAPKHLGDAFLKVYRAIVDKRLAAKHSGDKVTADALKIVINSSFGKFGSKWSTLFSPDLLIQTTITGQLTLLMLIEMLELEGIPVVSANTDGVVIACPRVKIDAMDNIVCAWEIVTGFDTEATFYSAIYNRDVNNYIALKADGGFKTKGTYAPAGLSKNPTNTICTDAVIAFLQHGVPIITTITSSRDITKFVTIRSVKGGAIDQDGEYLGKAVRWYYSTETTGPLRYQINNYTVPRSEGAKGLMQLPEHFPSDINYAWYIREANSILKDIGGCHA